MNAGPLTMSNGLTRLETRFLGEPDRVAELLAKENPSTRERQRMQVS